MQPIVDADHRPWNWIGAIQLASAGAPTLAWANARELHLANGVTLSFPGGSSEAPPSPEGILQLDFNYDFKTDIALAGEGGARISRQEGEGHFIDVTNQAGLPRTVLDARYQGAWAADIESDGALDIVLGSREAGPVVLGNNGDGTFTPVYPFPEYPGIRQFAWADLDGDEIRDAVPSMALSAFTYSSTSVRAIFAKGRHRQVSGLSKQSRSSTRSATDCLASRRCRQMDF